MGSRYPVPRFVDGGGETIIKGTDEKANGATSAAYGITRSPTSILIDRDGRVVGEFRPRSRDDMNTLRRMAGVPTDGKPFALTHTPQWKKRFDNRYQLETGQTLRLISPPFIPERAAFVTWEYNCSGGAGGLPDRLTLLDKGGDLQNHGNGSARLLDILKSLGHSRDPDDLFDCVGQ